MKYVFLPFLALLSFTGRSMAQTDGLSVLHTRFDAWRTRTVQEKLFVHTDKPDYLAGEILWFKIYCVDAFSHAPLDLSKVCYVDVLDKDDRFLLQAKIDLQQAEGKGSFFLPLTLPTGNYKLRAYTNLMKNFGPSCFYEQAITIINTLKELPAPPEPATAAALPGSPSAASAQPADSTHGIVLFPEGGNLVQDLPSRIAFRITGPDGKGTDRQGVLVDEHNDTVASFVPLHFGIGQFGFTPAAGHQYKALVSFPDSTTISAALPAAYDKGYVMHVGEGSDGRLVVTVHARNPSSPDVYLFGRSGPSSRLALSATLVQDSAEFRIDKDSLGEGITQLTVFDGLLHPVCERLYFRRPGHRLSIGLASDKEQYATRRKIDLSLSVDDKNGVGDPAPASLSLSVYRLDSLHSPAGMDMAEYLWMGADLKGRVDSPGYYFTASGPEADQALDNLMLTHGWRRFRWEQHVRDNPAPLQYPAECSGHIVTGRLTDMRTGLPLIDRVVSLSTPGIDYRYRAAVTDSSGRMLFDVKDFYGQQGIVIHTGTAVDSPCKVDIFSPFSESTGGDRLPAFAISDAARQSLLSRSLNMQVQNIYTGDSLQRFWPPNADTLHFYNIPDHSYMLDDYTRFTTMEEVLREYVHEVNVNRPHGRLHILMLNEPERQFFDDNNTLVMLDGVPVPDDKIFSYDPLKVKKLEVMSHRYYLGPAFYSGVLSFTTYKGDFEGLELDRHSTQLDYDGLQWQREFYAPVYETDQQRAARLPDFRNLLFWSPDIHTQGKEKKDYTFYTSDLPGSYLVVVQGISADGRIGYSELPLEVK